MDELECELIIVQIKKVGMIILYAFHLIFCNIDIATSSAAGLMSNFQWLWDMAVHDGMYVPWYSQCVVAFFHQ